MKNKILKSLSFVAMGSSLFISSQVMAQTTLNPISKNEYNIEYNNEGCSKEAGLVFLC